jgi:hypothetical protein
MELRRRKGFEKKDDEFSPKSDPKKYTMEEPSNSEVEEKIEPSQNNSQEGFALSSFVYPLFSTPTEYLMKLFYSVMMESWNYIQSFGIYLPFLSPQLSEAAKYMNLAHLIV